MTGYRRQSFSLRLPMGRSPSSLSLSVAPTDSYEALWQLWDLIGDDSARPGARREISSIRVVMTTPTGETVRLPAVKFGIYNRGSSSNESFIAVPLHPLIAPDANTMYETRLSKRSSFPGLPLSLSEALDTKKSVAGRELVDLFAGSSDAQSRSVRLQILPETESKKQTNFVAFENEVEIVPDSSCACIRSCSFMQEVLAERVARNMERTRCDFASVKPLGRDPTVREVVRILEDYVGLLFEEIRQDARERFDFGERHGKFEGLTLRKLEQMLDEMYSQSPGDVVGVLLKLQKKGVEPFSSYFVTTEALTKSDMRLSDGLFPATTDENMAGSSRSSTSVIDRPAEPKRAIVQHFVRVNWDGTKSPFSITLDKNPGGETVFTVELYKVSFYEMYQAFKDTAGNPMDAKTSRELCLLGLENLKRAMMRRGSNAEKERCEHSRNGDTANDDLLWKNWRDEEHHMAIGSQMLGKELNRVQQMPTFPQRAIRFVQPSVARQSPISVHPSRSQDSGDYLPEYTEHNHVERPPSYDSRLPHPPRERQGLLPQRRLRDLPLTLSYTM